MNNSPFRFLRLIFVVASLSPVFILWGIKGSKVLPDSALLLIVFLLVSIPNGILILRWISVRKQNLIVQTKVLEATDHREHLVVYLLAVLLAIFGASLESTRDLIALAFTAILVTLLFWYSNLHYLNLIFALLGYKTFTVKRLIEKSGKQETSQVVVLTKRDWIQSDEIITCLRLSHNTWIEK